jgi:hypothetical protein
MPPPGVERGTKRARRYEHVRESARDQGAGESKAVDAKK